MKLAATTLLFVAGFASAHPGHDHSSWTSPLLHALWIAPVVITLAFAIHFVLKKQSK